MNNADPQARASEIENLVASNELNQATKRLMDLVTDFSDSKSRKRDVINIRASYTDLNDDQRRLGKTDDMKIEMRKLREQILEFAELIVEEYQQTKGEITSPEDTDYCQPEPFTVPIYVDVPENVDKIDETKTEYELDRDRFRNKGKSFKNYTYSSVFEGHKISRIYNSRAGKFKLFNIDINLKLGEITAVVGENGNGKTTLLKIIAGELATNEGKITYPCLNLNSKPDLYYIKQKIAYIPQELPKWYGLLADNLHEVILHTANLKELLENERKGILSIEEIRREKNRLVYALLNLINEIEQEIATKKDKKNQIVNTINKDKIIKILFLAANPLKTTHLKLDQESRSIDQALRQSEFRDKFEIIQHWAVRVSDLQEILLRHKPDIIHFSGHGSLSSEIILEDNSGNSHFVSVRALSQLFSILKDNIRCVVLNACYSEVQAKAIAQHIDSVVGMSKAIKDDSAISFATSFYQALGYGRDVKTAFDLGCVQIDMENLDEQDTPQLLALKCSPTTIFFTNDI